MIAINLLPHREQARKKKRDQFFVHLGLAALLGLASAGAVYAVLQFQIDGQAARNQLLQTQIQQLDAEIRDVATLQQELEALKSRQAAVETLQAGRNLPVHLLDELVRQTPEGVHLTNLRQEGMALTLAGVAQSQERVSELLRNLSQQARWVTQPQLIEIVSATLELSPRDPRRVFNFTVRANLNPSPPAQNPADAAPAPTLATPAGTTLGPVLAPGG